MDYHYLLEVAYTCEAWEAMIRNPTNRPEVLRSAVEQMNGKVVASWVCDGEFDAVVILQLKEEVSGLAATLAVKRGGGVDRLRWIRLFSWNEAMDAMSLAGRSSYRSPAWRNEQAVPEAKPVTEGATSGPGT